MKHVLISGGSGLVGTHLTKLLQQKGYFVSHLSRSTRDDTKEVKQFHWNPAQHTINPEAIAQADIVVHLAGAGVADQRWTKARKKEIIDSRVQSAQVLTNELKRQKKKLSAFISASAVGWYGMTISDQIKEESEPAYPDFFGDCCRLWEKSVDEVESTGTRLVKLRIGIILAREGGFLPKVAGPVRWFVGSPLGSGKQWIPWIHIDDVCALFLQAIEQETMQGVYNAVGPEHTTNKTITEAIGRTLHRPVVLPAIPAFLLKIMLGEMAMMIVNGNRISNQRILKTGFQYQFPTLKNALNNLLD